MTFSHGQRSALFVAGLLATIATVTSVAHGEENKTVQQAAVAAEPEADEPNSLLELLMQGRETATPEERTETTTAAPAETPPSAERTAKSDLKALIHKHASAEGVPPELAEAVVKVESNFNPRARGRAGEVGLMQIKPATARAIGYRGTTKALYDPETNLAWGMRYLATAYQLAGGDTCGAILRYNGGHAARKMTRQARAYCGKVQTYVAAL
jgi:soluble lytic murein transglycosylase-like protein